MLEVATALLFDSEGKLLIYLRDDKPDIPFPNHWDLFGGHIEAGESAEMALFREIREELGIEVVRCRPFRIYHCLEGDAAPNIKHVFIAHINQRAEDLTLYEGQYHKAITLAQRHNYTFANILGSIVNDFAVHS